jgi:aldose sugar dehydrogenase
MLFARDGTLFVTTSEHFADDTRIKAQDIDSLLGKIPRINTDGSAATGNPYYDVVAAKREIWSIGNRNSQGISFNPLTGDLWETEFGPQAGDEVNIIKPGHNYGWPVVAYGMEYYPTYINDKRTDFPGMDQPVYYWNPTVGPSGATFFNRSLMPEWRNNLFVATHAGEHLIRLVIKHDKVVGEERLLLDQHQEMRDVQQGPDGALWVLTDDTDGRIIRLGPKK